MEGERGDTDEAMVREEGDTRKVRARMCPTSLHCEQGSLHCEQACKGSESSQAETDPCGASARLSPANGFVKCILLDGILLWWEF